MKVHILFFAQLRDAFGTDQTTLEIKEGTTVSQIVKTLFQQFQIDSLIDLPLLYALNENFTEKNVLLKDQDTLALLPPMAGG